MKLPLLSSVFAIFFSLAILPASYGSETATPADTSELPATPVEVGPVSQRTSANQVELVGTVQAVQNAEISAKIAGNIITMPVELGSQVQKGALLVELSAGEISAKVQQSSAQLEQARRNLTREENLLKKNAATPETVKSLRDSLRIAEAAHREAQTMLEYSRITAPFTGIITKKVANVGDLATPGKLLLNIEEETNLQVLTAIPEAMLLKIRKGDILPISVASANISMDGTVAEVSPIADPSSRTAPVKLNVKPNPNLRSGQFARVALTMPEVTTLAIPRSAVISFGQMELVFVVKDKHAAMRLVRTGARWQDAVEILSGLTGDETVITGGNGNLVDGQPVVIR